YGRAGSKTNGRRTGPSTGQVHARADAGTARAHNRTTASRRTGTSFVVRTANGTDGTGAIDRCQYWLQSTTVELVLRRPRQPRDDLRSTAARDSRHDELRDRGRRAFEIRIHPWPRPDHERDLAAGRRRKSPRKLIGTPADDQGRGRGGRAGQDSHCDATIERSRHEARARIADAGEPRIRDERHPLPREQPRQKLRGPLPLVVLVVRKQPGADAVALEQHT